MIRGIVGQSLHFRFLVIVVAVVLLLGGFTQLRDMPVDAFPEFAPPFVEIQTEALGLSTAEVESFVTVNLEMLLSGTPGLQAIRSRSVPGLSSILLIFERGTDIMRARLLVQERLTLARTLPHVSKPPAMLQPLSATSRVMMVGLSSDELSLIDMSVLARWTIKPRLQGVEGVANVAIWGQRKRQMQVQVIPERLQANGVTLDQVIEATGNALWTSPLSYLYAAYPSTGGWIDTPQQRIGVRHVLPISSPDDLANVTIESRNGIPILLGDVAEVIESHPPLIGDAVLQSGAGILLVVEKFPGSNTLQVTRDVEDELSILKRGLPGVEVDSQVFQAASFIDLAIGNITRTLSIGAILGAFVLVAFLFDWRTALISLLAISVSLMVALLVVYFSGMTFNIMILAGLVIGLSAVVDDAIIDPENILRRLRQHREEGTSTSILTIIIEASLEMRSAIIFATFIMLLAVLPIFSIGGVTGAFIKPLAISYSIAIVASMAVALILTPALSVILLSNAPLERYKSPLVGWLKRNYERILSRTVRKPSLSYIIAIVIVLAGLGSTPFLRQDFLPTFKVRDLVIRWDGPPGTSLPEMVRIVTQAIDELQLVPGVENVNAHVGRAVEGDEVVGVNSSQLWIKLDPSADYETTQAAIQETIDNYPGFTGVVHTYLQESISEVTTGTSNAIIIRIYGPEMEVLYSQVDKVRQKLSGITGISNLRTDEFVEEPNFEIIVDLTKAGYYGLIPGDLRRAATTLISGLEVGSLFEEKKVFDAVVWAIPEARNSMTTISDLLIDTPGGEQVRLGDVAEVRLGSSPTVIKHDANAPHVDLGFNIQGRDPDSVLRDVENVLQEIDFPLEYHPEVLGELAERQTTRLQVAVVFVAVIGIFLLLHAAFDSWRLASLSFLTLPVALSGGIIAALLGGGIVSVGSLVGFLTVLGIAARNGIMLIDHYRHLEQHEGETFGTELILRGARERLAPILMTVLVTMVIFVPFVLSGTIAGHEIEYPMAIVVLGGLITATILNLFVIPTLYFRFGRPGSEPVTTS